MMLEQQQQRPGAFRSVLWLLQQHKQRPRALQEPPAAPAAAPSSIATKHMPARPQSRRLRVLPKDLWFMVYKYLLPWLHMKYVELKLSYVIRL